MSFIILLSFSKGFDFFLKPNLEPKIKPALTKKKASIDCKDLSGEYFDSCTQEKVRIEQTGCQNIFIFDVSDDPSEPDNSPDVVNINQTNLHGSGGSDGFCYARAYSFFWDSLNHRYNGEALGFFEVDGANKITGYKEQFQIEPMPYGFKHSARSSEDGELGRERICEFLKR